MPVREKNYWLETTTTPPVPSERDLPDAIDVAVVGAGYCGLSAARTLAKRGVKVAVFESETFGWGASSRNGGMVLTGMKLPVPTLIKRYGRETVRKMYAVSLQSIDCVEQIVRQENIDCNFSRCGHLEVACKQAHFDAYEESSALVKREFNHELRTIPKSELRSEIGSHIYFGGMVDETSVGLNPARYVAGLALAARRAGACLHDHTRVTSIDPETSNGARQFRVQTSKGAITAREVLLASGAYTTEATPALRKKTETENTVRQSAEILRRGMIGVYPQLRDTKIEFVWGGTLDFTLDVMPHAGKIDGMYFAAGFSGHGVAAATWFGEKLAGLICGDPNDVPFDGIKFPAAPLGLRSGNTWALPLVGAWYKILDWLT